jgi:hypothetical protein
MDLRHKQSQTTRLDSYHNAHQHPSSALLWNNYRRIRPHHQCQEALGATQPRPYSGLWFSLSKQPVAVYDRVSFRGDLNILNN